MNHEEARALLEKQFTEGQLPPLQARALKVQLSRSPKLREEYNRYVELERTLSQQTTPQAQVDRLLARGAPVTSSWRKSAVLRFSTGLLALAAGLLLFALVRPAPSEFTARSGRGDQAWIKAYRVAPKEPPEPLREQMQRGDGLLFSYRVLKGSEHRFLAIMAKDAQGRVHWLYPAYRDPSESPRSIPVQPNQKEVELPDMVLIKPAAGKMRICGVFTERALDVKTVDRGARARGAVAHRRRLELPGSRGARVSRSSGRLLVLLALFAAAPASAEVRRYRADRRSQRRGQRRSGAAEVRG